MHKRAHAHALTDRDQRSSLSKEAIPPTAVDGIGLRANLQLIYLIYTFNIATENFWAQFYN
jgi:hypothetical protein